MSNENDQSGNYWDDDDEHSEPQSWRDAYSRAESQNRPQPRSRDLSSDNMPDRASNRVRKSDLPLKSTEGPLRSRPARQSREEVYARLRRRPRRPIYSREQDETRTPSPGQPGKQARSASYRSEAEEYPYTQQSPTNTPRPTRGSQSGTPTRSSNVRPADYSQIYDEGERAYYREQRGRDRAAAYDSEYREGQHGRTRNTEHDEYSARQRGQYRAGEYEEYDEYEVIQARQRRRPKRRRRVFSTLLTGCIGGLLTLLIVGGVLVYLALHETPLGSSLGIGKSTYTRSAQQTLALGNATQLIINDQAGNVSLNIDQTASSASVSSIKKVQASSQSDANMQFSGLVISTKQVSQGETTGCTASSCFLISATLPTTGSGGLSGARNNDRIDLNITLPPSFNSPNPLAPYTISASDPAGNIAVNGFNGLLNLSGKVGTITVTHALLYAGTCIETMHGNVNVGQESFFNLAQSSHLVPCSNTSESGSHPWFNLRSSVGNVNVTLPTNSTNLILDASTNNGKITNDFNLNITTDGASATYHGPILPNSNPTASLYLFTSTGNIALHRG